METIKTIEEVYNINSKNVHQGLNGTNGARLGMSQMIQTLSGWSSYDGYRITTDEHIYHILIHNGQRCCENWGYFTSNDYLKEYENSKLINFKLTDTALNTKKLIDEELMWDNRLSLGRGGIQFVDIETDKGVLQLAVYNGHNGYYGHEIVIAKDDEILANDVL